MAQHTTTEKITALRRWLIDEGLAAFIIPSTDPHAGEYVPDHWQSRAWLSGFEGSAGTVVVTREKAALWTDSRYFLAAEEALAGTGIVLMKEGLPETPSQGQWLAQTLHAGDNVGMDGLVSTNTMMSALREELAAHDISVRLTADPFAELWPARPALPLTPVSIHPLALAGECTADKLTRLRRALSAQGCEAMLVTALDETAWLLNLRGTDVHCNPLFVSYLLVTPTSTTLFINPEKVTPEAAAQLAAAHIDIARYEDVRQTLEQLSGCFRFLITPQTNAALTEVIARRFSCSQLPSPVALMKAVKNAAEIAGFRQAHLRDGIAMVKFLSTLLPRVEAGLETELTVDERLTALRRAQADYRDISFDTIAGYGAHGAIVHYKATPQTALKLEPRGLLLLDSGAHYADGTTDITRTIALGPTTAEERKAYTLVLKGHIQLSRCRFPQNTTGTQLDLAARYAMWQEGYNYGHGTGHGVGAFLNVHEGPHQIRMNFVPTPLAAGMVVTNEPGIYVADKFGVRIENILLVTPHSETPFGSFFGFEPLTLCPIDTAPIELSLMTDDELSWLNDYHALVRHRLLPLLTDTTERDWLTAATAPLCRAH